MAVRDILMASSGVGGGSINYVDDVFSAYASSIQTTEECIPNNIPLESTVAWSTVTASSDSLEMDVLGIAVDSSGNKFVVGESSTAAVLVKYNSSGVAQWSKSIGGSTNNTFRGVATDSSGNVYCVGSIGTASICTVTKHNSSGTLQWQRSISFTTFAQSNGYSIAVTSSGNLYVGFSARTTSPSYYAAVIKLDASTGGTVWTRRYDTNGLTNVASVAIDSSENVYLIGIYNDTTATYRYTYLIKFDSSGNTLWTRVLTPTTATDMVPEKILVDSTSSNIYVLTTNSVSEGEITLHKITASAVKVWSRKLYNQASGTTYNALAPDMVVDSLDNIYVALTREITKNPYYCGELFKFDSSGNNLSMKRIFSEPNFKKEGSTTCNALCLDSTGNLFVGGQYAISTTTSKGYYLNLKEDLSAVSGVASVYLFNLNILTTTSDVTVGSLSLTPSTTAATNAAASNTFTSESFTGSTTTQPAVTGLGGMVWGRSRTTTTTVSGDDWALVDTVRGIGNNLGSDSTSTNVIGSVSAFNANGFTTNNGDPMIFHTFAKQSKFFDVVTYTGNGANRTIPHSLGSAPGCIMIKSTSATTSWIVYHRGLTSASYGITLNSTAAETLNTTYWNATAPTSSVFSLGTNAAVNTNGATYVAYIFAHDAGGFGSSGSENVITCGNYTGNGSSTGPVISLGYEPQYILIKKATGTATDWVVFDYARGITITQDSILRPNSNTIESSSSDFLKITPNGFSINSSNILVNISSANYIYIAIRRPMKPPTSGTQVFSPILSNQSSSPNQILMPNFTVDSQMINLTTSGGCAWYNRLTLVNTGESITSSGQFVDTTSLGTSNSGTGTLYWLGNSFATPSAYASLATVYYSFKRAPTFFDTVTYTGTGTATTVNHGLTVVPELIIVKTFTGNIGNWWVYHKDTGNTNYTVLNSTAAAVSSSTAWNNTTPTSSVFSIGTGTPVNASGSTIVAQLFATAPGVSKVGSYTGTGTTNQINCGFTGGARYILIKRTDTTGGNWYVWDTARGISSGNDPYYYLNSSTAPVTGTNYINTYSAGFEITSAAPAEINGSGGTFIYLAIA